VEEKNCGRAADSARAIKISEATLSRIFSGHVKTINDSTADKISRVLKIPLPEMMILSMGGMPAQVGLLPLRGVVNDGSERYSDLFDRLSVWLRNGASDDGKKSILMMAQALGFQDQRLTGVLDALCEPARSRAG
jgi:hypothetical protein